MLKFSQEHIVLPKQKNVDGIAFRFQAVNKGNIPLRLELKPTCGCTNVQTSRIVSPNSSTVVDGTMNRRPMANTMNVQTFKKKINYSVHNSVSNEILKEGALTFEVELIR